MLFLEARECIQRRRRRFQGNNFMKEGRRKIEEKNSLEKKKKNSSQQMATHKEAGSPRIQKFQHKSWLKNWLLAWLLATKYLATPHYDHKVKEDELIEKIEAREQAESSWRSWHPAENHLSTPCSSGYPSSSHSPESRSIRKITACRRIAAARRNEFTWRNCMPNERRNLHAQARQPIPSNAPRKSNFSLEAKAR